jgi:hypothetical protein
MTGVDIPLTPAAAQAWILIWAIINQLSPEDSQAITTKLAMMFS